MLVCSATGGYPPITNISLLKNGDMMASATSESTLQVNIADLPTNINHYGLYICLSCEPFRHPTTAKCGAG